jgi:hypothetical protein
MTEVSEQRGGLLILKYQVVIPLPIFKVREEEVDVSVGRNWKLG